jgi:hypothetical protein
VASTGTITKPAIKTTITKVVVIASAGKLTSDQRHALKAAERAIGHMHSSTLAAGEALRIVHDGKLYRETHGTFDAWYTSLFELERSHVYRLMHAAEVIEILQATSPTGELPRSERQARPLVSLKDKPTAMVAAMKSASESARRNGRRITTADVEAGVKAQAPKPATSAPAEAQSSTDAPAVVVSATDKLDIYAARLVNLAAELDSLAADARWKAEYIHGSLFVSALADLERATCRLADLEYDPAQSLSNAVQLVVQAYDAESANAA